MKYYHYRINIIIIPQLLSVSIYIVKSKKLSVSLSDRVEVSTKSTDINSLFLSEVISKLKHHCQSQNHVVNTKIEYPHHPTLNKQTKHTRQHSTNQKQKKPSLYGVKFLKHLTIVSGCKGALT